MAVYYNEWDPFMAQWLRNLIEAGHLPPGDVDERDIREIVPDDLKGYAQHHFFAGVGGWSEALGLAGWPADRPVWTGSCPCQPFSAAGKRLREKDERHLWPTWFQLIRQCEPATVFGEQVASSLGREWLSGVRADLETVGYAVGGADLCAAGVGSPQIRQRLWWVSYASSKPIKQGNRPPKAGAQPQVPAGGHDLPSGVSDATSVRQRQQGNARELVRETEAEQEYVEERISDELGGSDSTGGVCNPSSAGRRSAREPGKEVSQPETVKRPAGPGDAGFWSDFDILPFQDGKARRVEPGTFPLAHGVSGRMAVVRTVKQAGAEVQETHWYNRAGALSGFGNAINPQTAAVFIRACAEIIA